VYVDEESCLALPALYCGINTIASDLSALPLELVQRMPDGRTRKAVEHPAWKLFARSPDGVSTPMRWRQAFTAHCILYGGGFAQIVRSVDNSRIWLYLLDPAMTTVQYLPDWTLRYQTNGGLLEPSQVVHWASLSHDGITGHPLIKIARESIGLGIAAQRFGGSYIGNASSIAGFFKPPNDLTPEAKCKFLESVSAEHQGPELAGRMGTLPVGWDFQELGGGASPESAQLLDLRQFSVSDVARLLRVPQHKLGVQEGQSYASIEAMQIDYVSGTLLPLAESLEQSLSLRILTDDEVQAGYAFRTDFRSILRADATARSNRLKTLFMIKGLTPNEARIEEGYDPIDDPTMNQTYMQLNMGDKPAATDGAANGQ
jgi:HK97 family phage portal protein